MGLAWDGDNLWVSQADSASSYPGMILEVDSNGNTLSFFQAPGQWENGPRPKGLAYDGTYLWNVDFIDEKIFKLTKTGGVISSIPAPSGISSGLAWDGEYIWVSEWDSYKIYKINPENGGIVDSFNAPDFENEHPYGLAWDGTYLWSSNSNGIYKINPETGAILGACQDFDFQNGQAYGLTWDGQYLWAGSSISSTIMKIDISNLNGDGNPENGKVAGAATISLSVGWNMVSSMTGITTSDTFSDDSKFASIWKWEDNKWVVYLPGQDTQSYAESKGFEVLSTIEPGEGFWLNAKSAETV